MLVSIHWGQGLLGLLSYPRQNQLERAGPAGIWQGLGGGYKWVVERWKKKS